MICFSETCNYWFEWRQKGGDIKDNDLNDTQRKPESENNMWKCKCFVFMLQVGFFNRNRPPCDDDDDAEHLAGAGQSEYAEMPPNTDDKQA